MATKKSAPVFMHEIRDGQHRIVAVYGDSTNHAGEWVAITEVAYHDEEALFAVIGEGVLPQGIFRCKVQPHQILS